MYFLSGIIDEFINFMEAWGEKNEEDSKKAQEKIEEYFKTTKI